MIVFSRGYQRKSSGTVSSQRRHIIALAVALLTKELVSNGSLETSESTLQSQNSSAPGHYLNQFCLTFKHLHYKQTSVEFLSKYTLLYWTNWIKNTGEIAAIMFRLQLLSTMTLVYTLPQSVICILPSSHRLQIRMTKSEISWRPCYQAIVPDICKIFFW